jgi:hypothetical protein
MKLFDELNSENFELFAAKYYENPSCIDAEDFYDDVAKFKYIIRLLRRYRDSGKIQERLVLNHIITIYNVFQLQAATRMLFYRIDEDLWPVLKTFLVFLNYIPQTQYKDINVDLNIAKILNKI